MATEDDRPGGANGDPSTGGPPSLDRNGLRRWLERRALRARVARLAEDLNLENLSEEEQQQALRVVHRANQRALLMGALEIQLNRTPAGRLLGAPPRAPIPLRRWRKACGREIEEAMAGGFRVAGELLACVVQEPVTWPSTQRLASELERLGTGLVTQWMLVRVHSVAGDLARVRQISNGMDLKLLPSSYRACIDECLAIAQEREGDPKGAFLSFERAARPGGQSRVLFAGALIALELGHEEVFEGWRRRLATEDLADRDLQRGLSELICRRELLGLPIDPAHLVRLDCCWKLAREPFVQRGLVQGAGAKRPSFRRPPAKRRREDHR